MGASPQAAKALLDGVLRGEPIFPPQRLWIGLHAQGGEITGSYYMRKPASFVVGPGGDYVLAEPAEFPEMNPTADLAEYGLYDAPAGGTLWFTGTFESPRDIPGGETVRIPAGGITIGAT